MDALWDTTPGGVVFFVAGAGQGGAGNWGSGFTTDKATVAVNDYSGEHLAGLLLSFDRPTPFSPPSLSQALSHTAVSFHNPPPSPPDPNPFFQALLKKPFRAATVISPSVYTTDAPPPPADPQPVGGGAPAQSLPAWPAGPAPIKLMDTTFAYLAKEGYCLDSDCQRFPVAVGEFATRFTKKPELDALDRFAAHLAEAGVEYEGVGTWRYWGFESGEGRPQQS
jgi:hypothetical protein